MLTRRRSHTRYRTGPSAYGRESEPLYREPLAVRVCREHGLDCTEDGDRVLCPAGHELEWPRAPRVGPAGSPDLELSDEAEVPWRVELRRSARIEW